MSTDRLSATFSAIADPTRRAILARLEDSDARVTELASAFPISLNSTSKHIRVLERAGLVRRTVRGREHILTIARDSDCSAPGPATVGAAVTTASSGRSWPLGRVRPPVNA